MNWHKLSYMLEFMENGVSVASFGFSIPPQTEEFRYPQRVYETKTFGGCVIDDFGNDTNRIVLNGTTANNSVRLIFSNKTSVSVSGEEEVFFLQELLQTYGENEKLGKKSIKLYCQASQGKGLKSWDVVVDDFQIRRDSSNPMAYTYVLSCIGVPNSRRLSRDGSTLLDGFEKTAMKYIGIVNDGANWLGKWVEPYQEGFKYINKIKNIAMSTIGIIDNYVSALKGYIDTTTTYVTETLALGSTVIQQAERSFLGSGIPLLNGVKELSQAVADFAKYIRNFKEESISPELIDEYKKTGTEIKDVWEFIANKMETESAQVEADSRQIVNNNSPTIQPGGDGGDDTVRSVYGTYAHTCTDNDDWDVLSKKYYGNVELGGLIAAYNSNLNTEIKVGEVVYVPILNSQECIGASNKVYPANCEKDNYGRDLAIGETGDFVVEQGDLKVLSGADNLNQAIMLRLGSAVDSRIRLDVYGIRSNIGDVNFAQNFILTSIKATLMAEPRIQSVDKIVFVGKDSYLNINIEYTDINKKKQTLGGFF